MTLTQGAPETLKDMYAEVPKNYDETYLTLSRRGARVLALGIRELGSISNQVLRDMKRESVECELRLIFFLV